MLGDCAIVMCNQRLREGRDLEFATRRRLLDLRLTNGGGTATTLSEQLPVTRKAFGKHLGVRTAVPTWEARDTVHPGEDMTTSRSLISAMQVTLDGYSSEGNA